MDDEWSMNDGSQCSMLMLKRCFPAGTQEAEGNDRMIFSTFRNQKGDALDLENPSGFSFKSQEMGCLRLLKGSN